MNILGELSPSIIAFVGSILFLGYVSRKRKIGGLSLYWVFGAFQCLYNLMPWLVSRTDIQFFQLLSDQHVVDLQVLLASASNVFFGLVFLLTYESVPLDLLAEPGGRKRRNFVVLTIPVFLVACLVCAKYGWRQLTIEQPGQQPTGMYSVAIDAKLICASIYLYYLSRFGLDRWAWVLFAEHAILMAIDNARTTFLPLAVLTLFLYAARIGKTKNKRTYVLALSLALASVGVRALFMGGESLIVDFSLPIMVEGTMGSYPSLQAIYAIEHKVNQGFTYGASYVIDPIVWFFPHGELRENSIFFKAWTSKIASGIPDDFAPWGGFYYISEAVAAFSYLGPPIITTLFAVAIVWFEKVKNKYPMLYMAWVSTIGVLFVKTVFAGIVKVFIIQLGVMYCLAAIHQLRVLLAHPVHSTPGESQLSSRLRKNSIGSGRSTRKHSCFHSTT